MSLPSEQSYIVYTGNNSTSTPYPIPFKFFYESDIVVKITDADGNTTTLTPVTDYDVTGGDEVAGAPGNVTTILAYDSTNSVRIERTVEYVQDTEYTDIGKFPSQSIDRSLDLLTMATQQLQRQLGEDTGTVQEFAKLPLATDQETIDGTLSDRATSPHGVKAAIDNATFEAGSYVEATENEAYLGLSGSKVITPRRVSWATERFRPSNPFESDGATILDESFTLASMERPFRLIAERFVELADDFTLNRGSYGGVSSTRTGGTLNISTAGRLFAPVGPKVPYCAAQILVTSQFTSSPVTAVGVCKSGSPTQDFIDVYASATAIGGTVCVGGVSTALSTTAIALTVPFKLAFVICGKILAAFYDSGNGWVMATSWDISATLDFRNQIGVDWRYCVYQGGSTGTAKLDDWRAGLFGETGRSSPYVVTYEDGTPIWEGRHVYVVCSVAGVDTSGDAGGYGNQHGAVYKLNVDSNQMECVSKLFCQRAGKILGDSFGPLFYNREDLTWYYIPSKYGDSTPTDINCRVYTSKASLLSGSHILVDDIGPIEVVAQQDGEPFYDCYIRKVVKDGSPKWIAVYTEGPPSTRHLAMDESDNLLSGWARVGTADPDIALTNYDDGGRIINYFGQIVAVWAVSAYEWLFYDLDMQPLATYPAGTLIYPTQVYGGAPPPHFEIFPSYLPDGTTRYKLITFTSIAAFTGAASEYGDTVIYDLSVTKDGYPFSNTPVFK